MQDAAQGIGFHLGDGKLRADIADAHAGDQLRAAADGKTLVDLGATGGTVVEDDEGAFRADADDLRGGTAGAAGKNGGGSAGGGGEGGAVFGGGELAL